VFTAPIQARPSHSSFPASHPISPLVYAGKADTVMTFVEDIFFGEKTVGMLDNIRKQYLKLKLALFSASILPLNVAARYLCWSMGSYLSLRDSEKEIASVLMLSRKTVQNHISNIYQKFGIRNMVRVLKLAVSKGILPVEELMDFRD